MTSVTLPTPAGAFTIVARDKAVLAAGFTGDAEALLALMHPTLRGQASAEADLDGVAGAVRAYFDGDLAALDTVEVIQSGGAFLEAAWDALREVPAGRPVSYAELASLAGRPAAIRGAAQACARNAAALFVPCHRVLRGDGSLGGYRYGLPTKQLLLDHERATPAVG